MKKQKHHKLIYIGGDSRTGGSLLARLFDGSPRVGAYPFESEYFINRNEDIINFDKFRKNKNLSDIENKEYLRKIRKFSEGKLHSKSVYSGQDPKLNYKIFINELDERLKTKALIDDNIIYSTIERLFFKHINKINNLKFVINHNSRTFLANLDSFFNTFKDSFFIHTLRDPRAIYASSKKYRHIIDGKEVKQDYSTEKSIVLSQKLYKQPIKIPSIYKTFLKKNIGLKKKKD